MDSIFLSKIIYAVIIFIISIISGLPLTYKSRSSAHSSCKLEHAHSHAHGSEFIIGEALASGVFLGAGLLHMLNDAAREFNELGYQYPLAYLLCGIVF